MTCLLQVPASSLRQKMEKSEAKRVISFKDDNMEMTQAKRMTSFKDENDNHKMADDEGVYDCEPSTSAGQNNKPSLGQCPSPF